MEFCIYSGFEPLPLSYDGNAYCSCHGDVESICMKARLLLELSENCASLLKSDAAGHSKFNFWNHFFSPSPLILRKSDLASQFDFSQSGSII